MSGTKELRGKEKKQQSLGLIFNGGTVGAEQDYNRKNPGGDGESFTEVPDVI